MLPAMMGVKAFFLGSEVSIVCSLNDWIAHPFNEAASEELTGAAAPPRVAARTASNYRIISSSGPRMLQQVATDLQDRILT